MSSTHARTRSQGLLTFRQGVYAYIYAEDNRGAELLHADLATLSEMKTVMYNNYVNI